MEHELVTCPDADALAGQAAGVRRRAAPGRRSPTHGRFTFAVSGGRTPWAMFAELATKTCRGRRSRSSRSTSGSRRTVTRAVT